MPAQNVPPSSPLSPPKVAPKGGHVLCPLVRLTPKAVALAEALQPKPSWPDRRHEEGGGKNCQVVHSYGVTPA